MSADHNVPWQVRKTKAVKFVRKLRGRSQAHLIEASDGQFYAVKLQNNPLGRRTLINEVIASALLHYLKIATPTSATIELDSRFLEDYKDVYIQSPLERSLVVPGWHFGSCYPDDSGRVTVYDYLPDPHLTTVTNLSAFIGALVFDKWADNIDSRQTIFHRHRCQHASPSQNPAYAGDGFVTLLIDNGSLFGGSEWIFRDSPPPCLYFWSLVYRLAGVWEDCQSWLELVRNCPETVLNSCLSQLPDEWIGSDRAPLNRLLERLYARRLHIADDMRVLRTVWHIPLRSMHDLASII